MSQDTPGLSRRRFLKHTGVGVAAGLAGCAKGPDEPPAVDDAVMKAAQTLSRAFPQNSTGLDQLPVDDREGPRDDGTMPMPTKRLGKTERMVSRLGFGGGVFVTPILLNRALDLGVTYLDTAQSYGQGKSEQNIGRILQQNGKRDRCFIVTKSGSHNAAGLRSRLETISLPRLQTDHVDLYYLHNLGNPDLLNDEMAKAAEDMKRAGVIKHFGFSSHAGHMVQCLERAAEVGFVDVIMFKYNFLIYGDEELNRALDKCAAADIGLVAMKTQAGHKAIEDRMDPFVEAGLKRQQAVIKAVYEDERITTIVSHMANVQQLEENAYATKHPVLAARERHALEEYRLAATREYCRGCGHRCMPQLAARTNVPDVLRALMYYEDYGDRRAGRALFHSLPSAERRIRGVDFRPAEAACPYDVRVSDMMRRADAFLA